MNEQDTASLPVARPGRVRRAAAGAWHVPAGFAFLFRRPRLWPFAALPALLALVLVLIGAIVGVYVAPGISGAIGPSPGRTPEWVELPVSLLLWTATIGACAFAGLAIALLLAAPLLDQLSRRVELAARGRAADSGRGLRWEIAQSLRGALYFVIAAPGVFLLGLIPLVGPVLSVLWGARAVALQMTDYALSRRGLTFAEKRAWHWQWLSETQGFGLAGMVGLLVPFANLLLAPALVTGGTLLVLEIEDLQPARPRPEPGADLAAEGAPTTG
jgi:CysZ protein